MSRKYQMLEEMETLNKENVIITDPKNEFNQDNIRTMEYVGEDNFSCPIYKCVETGALWKDINLGNGHPELYSCGNEFDGDPCYPISSEFKIHFVGIPEQPTKEEKFNYMLLSRLKSDCDYYLGFGNRYAGHLWAKTEREQIDKMKELYNYFSEDKKPEWLTMEQILEYEKAMCNES